MYILYTIQIKIQELYFVGNGVDSKIYMEIQNQTGRLEKEEPSWRISIL